MDERLYDTRDLAPAAGSRATGSPYRAESELLWTSSEGQVTNFGVFVLALLFCWLVFPVVYAIYRYLGTATHRYELSDQRLVVRSGIVVKSLETLELYRVRDLSVSSTLLQSLCGRGCITVISADTTSPRLVVNAIANPEGVATLLRNAVEHCRSIKGVRAFDL